MVRFSMLLSVGKGGFPTHFVSAQLAGAFAISLPSDQPHPSSWHGSPQHTTTINNTLWPTGCGEFQNKRSQPEHTITFPIQ